MNKLTLFFVFIFSFMFISYADAVTVEDLLKDPNLSSQTRQNIVEALDKSSNILLDEKNMTKWQAMGDAFAETIKTICTTLNVEVNAFIKTDVGKLTAVLITYHIIGDDILRVCIYSIALTFISFVTFIFLYMNLTLSKKHKEVKTLWESGNKKETNEIPLPKLNWEVDRGKEVSSLIAVVIWVISIIALLVNII